MENFEKYSPYIIEIRKRILFTLSLFAVGMLVGFVFYERIIKFLINILSLSGVNIVFTSPFQFINLAISCGLVTGLITVLPLLIFQVLSFLKPALKVKEFKMLMRFLPFSILLFITGFSFGMIVMKWQIELFLAKSVSLGIGNVLDISRLISTVLLVSALMGVAFQLPVITLLLTRIGIVKYEQLKKQRLWVYLGALFFTILLPLESIFADALLSIPLILLFEITLILSRFSNRHLAPKTTSASTTSDSLSSAPAEAS